MKLYFCIVPAKRHKELPSLEATDHKRLTKIHIRNQVRNISRPESWQTEIEEEGFMMYTAAHHQNELKIFCVQIL